MKEYDSRTALRLPREQREEIDRLVYEGKFKSISHVVRAAITEFLKNAQKEPL